MKIRKSSLLQRMFAVLLAAVLVTGMVSNSMPVSVLAAEEDIFTYSDDVTLIDGTLTIKSDVGMEVWINNKRLMHNGDEYQKLVTSAVIQSGVTGIQNSAFSSCSNLEKITIPNSVTSIGDRAFSSCSNLEKITIPNSVTSIGEYAFSNCSGLTGSITIPESVTSIGTSVFYHCAGLETVTIPEGVTSIGEYAFKDCIGLTGSITIPESVTSIGTYAFYGCTGLETVMMQGETPPTLGVLVFHNCKFFNDKTKGIHVPAGTAQDYKGAWKDWEQYITDGTYVVTVVKGTGGGEYEAGATITITAEAPASGMRFDRWEVNSGDVTLADSTSSSTTFAMPAKAVTVTATYKESISDDDKVAAAKKVVENALAGITATNATTKEEILGVINAALSNAGIAGVTVEIEKFLKYEASTSAAGHIEGVVFITCGQATGSVNMKRPIAKLTAGKYTVTVNSGTGGGEYEAGATVTITADASASGMRFDRWEVNSGSVALKNPTSSSTTFTMPAGAVSVTAIYITSTGGGNSNSNSGGGDSSNHNDGNGNSGIDTPAAAAEIRIITPLEQLKDAVLTETEKQQRAAGADIRIELDVEVVTAGGVSEANRALVEEALHGPAAGYKLGQYFDISLYKVIGNNRTPIMETSGKITVRIDVPDSLKNTDSGRTRTFAVIRVHDGGMELLADLDSDADTITIATDRFSTYVVVYEDAAAGTGKPENGKDAEPKTGDATLLELYATLAMIAGLSYLFLYFTDLKRGMTEETKRELVSWLVGWGKQGGRIRRCLALAGVFVLLVYYHSIGKKTCAEWKEVYGE